MRIKSIPKGSKIVHILNNSPRDIMIYHNKKPFLFTKANHFYLIESKNFFVGFSLKEFPKIDLYASGYIEMNVII